MDITSCYSVSRTRVSSKVKDTKFQPKTYKDFSVAHLQKSIESQNKINYNSIKGRHRLILETPFSVRNTVSYGLIVYAQDTKRWVIVQRKHSVEFLLFMRGLYRLTHLPLLLSHITIDEAHCIQKCLNEGPKIFKEIYLNKLGLSPDELKYALIRMAESRPVVINLLNKLDLTNNTLTWTWPKGRLNYPQSDSRLERETPFDCAKREFLEEAEIVLPAPLSISNTYISEIIRTITGRNIESRYWIYIIPNEIALNPPVNHQEVIDRKWVNTEECQKLLHRDELFAQIVQMVDKCIIPERTQDIQ